jgi:hypothetical protein
MSVDEKQGALDAVGGEAWKLPSRCGVMRATRRCLGPRSFRRADFDHLSSPWQVLRGAFGWISHQVQSALLRLAWMAIAGRWQ